MKPIKDEQAHWVHDLLFNDVDQTTAAVPYFSLADEFLNIVFIQFQLQVAVLKEMLTDTCELGVHDF